MSITLNTIDSFDTNVIAKLADNPNQSGLTAEELKRKFDEGADNLKSYLKSDFKTEMNQEITRLDNILTTAQSKERIRDMVYPVGSIYMSVSNVSPENFIGGTWQQITSDAYLKIVSNNGGQLGGTQDHRIGINNMPSHDHSIRYRTNVVADGKSGAWALGGDTYSGTSSTPIQPKGGGEPYYPYYLGVYLWKRIG